MGAEAAKTDPYRIYLKEDQIPTAWYNLRADMPEPPEPMRLPNGKVAMVDDIKPVFADELCRQELDDTTRYFEIPAPVMEMYKVYRPSPLCRAYNLERALDTPAKIYYKFEGNNTSGSHKLNSALAQAYYAYAQGITNITTETGAGQWGTALSEAAAHFGLNLDVFMVKCSYEQKPFRRSVMQTFGATITPSPSDTTLPPIRRARDLSAPPSPRRSSVRSTCRATRDATSSAACSTRSCSISRSSASSPMRRSVSSANILTLLSAAAVAARTSLASSPP